METLGYEVELLNPGEDRLVTRAVWADDGTLLIPAGGAVTPQTTVVVIPRGETERRSHRVAALLHEGVLDRLTLDR